MANKTKATLAETPSATPVAFAPAQSSSAVRPDPTLLGVTVPLSVTVAAGKQVIEAWKDCLQGLSVAVKAKFAKTEPVFTTASAPVATVSTSSNNAIQA